MNQPQPRDYRLPTPQLQVVQPAAKSSKPNPRLAAAQDFFKSLDQLNQTFNQAKPTENTVLDLDELDQEIKQLLQSESPSSRTDVCDTPS